MGRKEDTTIVRRMFYFSLSLQCQMTGMQNSINFCSRLICCYQDRKIRKMHMNLPAFSFGIKNWILKHLIIQKQLPFKWNSAYEKVFCHSWELEQERFRSEKQVQSLKFLKVKLLDVNTQNIQEARPLESCQNFESQSLENFVGKKKKYQSSKSLAIQDFSLNNGSLTICLHQSGAL